MSIKNGSNRSGTGTGGTTTKTSFSLNNDVLADLIYISDSIGISRSAFLSMLLAESLPTLRIAAEAVRTGDDPNEIAQRYCDGAADMLQDRIARLKGVGYGKLPS